MYHFPHEFLCILRSHHKDIFCVPQFFSLRPAKVCMEMCQSLNCRNQFHSGLIPVFIQLFQIPISIFAAIGSKIWITWNFIYILHIKVKLIHSGCRTEPYKLFQHWLIYCSVSGTVDHNTSFFKTDFLFLHKWLCISIFDSLEKQMQSTVKMYIFLTIQVQLLSVKLGFQHISLCKFNYNVHIFFDTFIPLIR